MTIKQKPSRSLTIDLDGPDGNAYSIMGYAQEICRKSGRDYKPLIKEMMSGDYLNLLRVFEREFGFMVTMETNNPEYLEALRAPRKRRSQASKRPPATKAAG